MSNGEFPATPSILFVDDEMNVLRSLNRLFFDEDYEIELANSGEEALGVLKQKTVHVIISDQRMPEMTGVEFLVETLKIQPDTVKVLLTGYTDLPAAQAAINEGKIYKFFTKPWQDIEIKLAVKRAVEYYFLRQKNAELLATTREQNKKLLELSGKLNEKVKDRTRTIVAKNKQLMSLNQQIADNFSKMIRIFLGFIELKSPELSNHSKRVAAAARYIAENMELPEDEIRRIEVASLLHDIGKLGLPEKIITAVETQMSNEEFNHYKNHPILGQNAIAGVEYLHKEGLIIRHHHENVDGSGFPDQLKGEEIPLGARIISAADSYDRFVTRIFHNVRQRRARVRKAMEALAGNELDEEIVTRLLKLMDERAQLDELLKDSRKTYREVALKPTELKKDMILSRDLYTSRGRLVLSKNRRIDKSDIKLVLDAEKMEKLFDEIFIYEQNSLE